MRRSLVRGRARAVRGFTLVELLIVMAVTGMLVALLIPVLGAARANTALTQCRALLHEVGMGINTYASDYNNTEPTEKPIFLNQAGIEAGAGAAIRAPRQRLTTDWNQEVPELQDVGQPGSPSYPIAGYQLIGVPVGLGNLFSTTILNATGGTATKDLLWNDAGYLANIDTLYCPTQRTMTRFSQDQPAPNVIPSWWSVRKHWNDGDDVNWGTTGKGAADGLAAFGDFDPGTGNSVLPYGFMDENIGYSYRCQDYSFMTSATAFCQQVNQLNAACTVRPGNCKLDAPGYAGKSVVAENSGLNWRRTPAHPQAGGGNVLWADGSVITVVNKSYVNGVFDTDFAAAPQYYSLLADDSNNLLANAPTTTAPYDIASQPFTSAGFKHGLLFAQIDFVTGH